MGLIEVSSKTQAARSHPSVVVVRSMRPRTVASTRRAKTKNGVVNNQAVDAKSLGRRWVTGTCMLPFVGGQAPRASYPPAGPSDEFPIEASRRSGQAKSFCLINDFAVDEFRDPPCAEVASAR